MQRYGTNPALDDIIDNGDWRKRRNVAEQGYGLDKLVNDESWVVRHNVAKQGYGLDKLINDEKQRVRAACIASDIWPEFCSNNWKTLIQHKDWYVRQAVAYQGYGLDKLINDDTWDVHITCIINNNAWWSEFCANNWETLIQNKDWHVRGAIAEQGYGLNKLIYDSDSEVRLTANNYLMINNYKSIDDWAAKNPNRVYSEINTIKEDIKDFIYKIDDSNKLEIQINYDNIDDFFISNEIDTLIVCTSDTKEPIIKIEKKFIDNKNVYKFIVDITTENDDNFVIKTTIKSKEQLHKKIEQVIDFLNQFTQFSKYANDLEQCL